MHDVGGIGMVPHRILTSIKYLVTNVLADGELLKIITRALKDILRVITKESRVTTLWIQNLSQDVVQNIVVGLQIHGLSISWISIKVHVLILLQSHILILSEFRCSAVGVT